MRALSWPGRLFLFSVLALLTAAPAAAQGGAAQLHPLAAFINDPVVSGCLLAIGMTALVAAIMTLGTGVAEFLAVVSFGLFYGARYMAGQEVLIPMALFGGALLLVALEIFVLPGHFVSGVLGLCCLGASVVMSFDDVRTGVVALLVSSVAALFGGILVFKMIPENRLLKRWMVLEPPALAPGEKVPPQALVAVGAIGVAQTPLRPNGIVDFEGQRVDVVTQGDFVAKGLYVEVLEAHGNRVVVKATPGQA